jgi:alanine racemase
VTDLLPTPGGGRLSIDLGALVANWRTLAALAPGARTAAVVKADAYGIGIEPAVRALSAAGCTTFFVALPDEGRRTRQVTGDAEIYVLNGLPPGDAPFLAAFDLRPVLGSMAEIDEWLAFRQAGGTTGCAVHIDTGMNRLGLSPAEAGALAADADRVALLAPALVMSHLAGADTPASPRNAAQLAAFRQVRELFPGVPASLANSAGIQLGSDFQFDLTRPGIALYGGESIAGRPPLRPVVTAEARVIQVREAKPGDAVGYGAAETLRRPSRIAILAAGYADGYHRAAGSADTAPGASVFIRGRPAPLVGRISMDLIAVDVTDCPDVRRGDWAELFGPHVPVDDVARRAGTIGYELLTGLGRRYARTYLH